MSSKLKLIGFALLLIIISSSFAQADSCNMWLVDEWTHECNTVPMCLEIVDSFIIAGFDSMVFVFDLDNDGTLTPIDSIRKKFNGLAVKDSFCYFSNRFDTDHLYVYKLRTNGTLDSVVTIDSASGSIMIVDDTLLFCLNGGIPEVNTFNISTPSTPVFLGSDEISGISSFFYADYPFLFNGGSRMCGEPPWYEWDQGWMCIHNAADFDSIYCTCEMFSEFGEFGHSSQFTALTKRDSILYIGGQNKFVNTYKMSNDGTSTEYLASWEIDVELPYTENADNMKTINNNLFTISNQYFHIFDISELDTLKCIAYYNHGDYETSYEYFVVKDSFYIGMGYDMDIDSVYITVAKFSDNGLGNCELRLKPDNFDLQISPNPFNSNCEIRYSLRDRRSHELSIYNVQGKKITHQELDNNSSSYIWDASNQSSGVYLVVLSNGFEKISRKILLAK